MDVAANAERSINGVEQRTVNCTHFDTNIHAARRVRSPAGSSGYLLRMTNGLDHEPPSSQSNEKVSGVERDEGAQITLHFPGNWLGTVLRLLITAVLLIVFFVRYSPTDLFDQLGGQLIPLAAAGMGLIFVALALNAARWILIARGLGAPLTAIDGIVLVLVGHFFNLMLPTSVGGDIVRVWGARKAGLRLKDAVTSVFFDRICGMITLAVLSIVGIAFLTSRLDSRILIGLAAMLVTGGVFGILILFNRHRVPLAWRQGTVWSALAKLVDSAIELLSRPLVAAGAIALSFLLQGSMLYLTFVLARAFGAELTLFDALTVVPAVLLLANLPISIGGWGIREASLAGGFAFLGLPIDVAIATSILIGLLNLLAGLPGAVLFVLRWGVRAFNSGSSAF